MTYNTYKAVFTGGIRFTTEFIKRVKLGMKICMKLRYFRSKMLNFRSKTQTMENKGWKFVSLVSFSKFAFVACAEIAIQICLNITDENYILHPLLFIVDLR